MDITRSVTSTEQYKFYIISAVLLIISVVFTSFTQLAVCLWSGLLGFVLVTRTFQPNSALSSLFLILNKQKRQKTKIADEFSLLKKICPVCGADQCPRHRPELNILALQPWTNLTLSSRINQALEEFLNLVLKNYVYTWYGELSDDESFVDEVKSCIRFVTAVLLRRLENVDFADLILRRLVRASLRHIDCYMRARNNTENSDDVQQATIDVYGPHIHIAMRSRQTELEYLKRLVDRCLPHLAIPESLRCPSMRALMREIISGNIILPIMDVIGDPDVVNKLLLIYFGKSAARAMVEPRSEEVTVLDNFSLPLSQSASSLHVTSIGDIMNNQEALYPFMQFLKSEASVHVLMFCLAVDEFNQKILDPELSTEQKANLHEELCHIYKTYMASDSVDKIQFESEILEGIKSFCDSPADEVTRLQRCTYLFRAYDHAYVLLENTFLPLFHQSDAFYVWLCGHRHSGRQVKDAAGKRKNQDQFGLSKISNRLKDVFRTSTIDGRSEDEIDVTEFAEERYDDDGFSETLAVPRTYSIHQVSVRDLSSWRVTIPRVINVQEPETKRNYYVFALEIRRLDVDVEGDTSWTVLRRYSEFYVLEQKLREFHGESLDVRLPQKKTLGTKNAEFMESRRPLFEQYIQSLLTRPNLKGSEMLSNFLTSDNELTSNLLPEINLSRMFRSVPMKLSKERGQHLEPFLATFLTSCEPVKPRPARLDDIDSDTVSISSENLANPLFENNANMELTEPPEQEAKHGDVSNVVDAVIYLAQSIWKAPSWFVRLLLTVRSIAVETIDDAICWYLSKRLVDLTSDHRIEAIIHLLRDRLFFDDNPPRTDKEKTERKENTLKELNNFIPSLVRTAVGQSVIEDGSESFLDLLQHPKLNKQLTYTFLDIVVDDIFDEVTRPSSGIANP